jgi:hypothetical protein
VSAFRHLIHFHRIKGMLRDARTDEAFLFYLLSGARSKHCVLSCVQQLNRSATDTRKPDLFEPLLHQHEYMVPVPQKKRFRVKAAARIHLCVTIAEYCRDARESNGDNVRH